MAYTHAVWIEDEHDQPFSGTVPTNWIMKPFVFWPPASKAAAAFKKRENPNTKTWSKFQLLKTKLQTDNFNEAEAVEDTSAAEPEEPSTVNHVKRSHKPTCTEGFVRAEDFGSDTESEHEPQAKKLRHDSGHECSKINISILDIFLTQYFSLYFTLQAFQNRPKMTYCLIASNPQVIFNPTNICF